MIKRWSVIVTALSLQAVSSGCGNPSGYYTVHGKVLHNGEPARGAVVYFHHDDSSAAGPKIIPYGIVAEDGSFYLTCDGVGDGCPPGKYAVLVEWRDGTGNGVVPVKSRGKTPLVKRGRVHSGPDKLNGRYFDISKPLLHAEVRAEPNALEPFELRN
jgi:hypothetical protein